MKFTRDTPTYTSSSAPIGENLGWHDLPIVGGAKRRRYCARPSGLGYGLALSIPLWLCVAIAVWAFAG